MKIKRKLIAVMLVVGLIGSLFPEPKTVEAKNIDRKVVMGEDISVYKEGAIYHSSDTSIAYVNANGRVTGKKTGTAVITVRKAGRDKKINLYVKKNQKKKPIAVCTDEIQIKGSSVKVDDTNVQTTSAISFHAKVTIKNNAEKPASKVVLTAESGDRNLKFTFGKVGAGETKTVTVSGKGNPDASIKPVLLQVGSNQMIHIYHFDTQKMDLDYGTKDQTKPVFSGFVGKNSYNDEIPYQVVYSDQAETYNFKKYVSVSDDRDMKVAITVDTSKVNFNKTGTYRVIYSATDAAGNTARTYAKIGIRVPNSLDSYCDTILSRITKSSWSNTRKAKAIYNYTRGHIAYTGYSNKSSWENAAINGIRYGRGDCFTYYAVSRALLTRAGIPNIRVNRVRGHGRHWWNMAYVQGGFYHFDACPRKLGGRFCLVTDNQLKYYSAHYGNSHIWAYDKKPKSGTKVLTSLF